MAYDFPASPTPGQTFNNYVWDGEKWKLQSPPVTGAVRYDIAQGLTSTQKSQARANIDVARKNYIINGAMMISQENGSNPSIADQYYPVDQFYLTKGLTAIDPGVVQVINVTTPGGSINRLRANVNTVHATVTAGEYCAINTKIEGLRVADLLLGTAAAKTVTLQFGVKAPAGTYCVGINNGTFNRSYVAEYTIAAGEANTDVVRTVTFTGDVTGTWAKDNTAGLVFFFTLLAGTTFRTSANTWTAGNFFATANQSNFTGTAGSNFELFDVSLTEGTVAPPFQVPDYASELLACQRYFEITQIIVGSGATGTFANQAGWKSTKRALPTIPTPSFNAGTGATFGVIGLGTGGIYQLTAHSGVATATVTGNARL